MFDRAFTHGAACVALLMTMCVAPNVHAQDVGSSAELLTTTTYAAGVVTAIGIVALVVAPLAVTSSTVGKSLQENELAQVEAYLRENEQGLREATALGSGEVFDDLVRAFALDASERVALAKVLRAQRATLLELAREDALDAERARRFVEELGRAMRADEVLGAAIARRVDG